jgi:hypothetical protein
LQFIFSRGIRETFTGEKILKRKREEKDYKPIKRDDKMSLAEKVSGMSSSELRNLDFESLESVRRAREEAYREKNKRRRELRWHYRIRKTMEYVERAVGWVDGVVGRFYSGKKETEGR